MNYETNFRMSGALAMVVTIAITTIPTNIFSVMIPAFNASVQRIIAMAPPTLNPKPTAIDLRSGIPPSLAPVIEPMSLLK